MNKKVWLSLFFLHLLCELLCIQLQLTEVRFVTKPLLILLLIGYFLSQAKAVTAPLKVWLVLALGFSWLGDVFLLFEYKAALFFILGLSSFLLAHLCYIYIFHSIRLQYGIKSNSLLVIPVVLYYAALMALLHTHLGTMKLPVYIYGLVICGMLFVALHLYKIREQSIGRLILVGAVLFVVSDSALAINKFYTPFSGAGIIIMGTYGLAQWCIAAGCAGWLQASVQQKKIRVTAVT